MTLKTQNQSKSSIQNESAVDEEIQESVHDNNEDAEEEQKNQKDYQSEVIVDDDHNIDSQNYGNEDFEEAGDNKEDEQINVEGDEGNNNFKNEMKKLDNINNDNEEQQEEESKNAGQKSKGSNIGTKSKKEPQEIKNEQKQVVEYRKQNYLLFLREIAGGKFTNGAKQTQQWNLKNLIYYRVGGKTWIEGGIGAVIEVPFERSQIEEVIEFKITAIFEEQEIILTRSATLKDLRLSTEQPTATFICQFDSRDKNSNPAVGAASSTYFQFALAFDAAILSSLSSEEVQDSQAEQEQSKTKHQKNRQSFASSSGTPSQKQQAPVKYEQKLKVFSVCLKEVNGYGEFVEERKKELREKLILNTSTSWHCRYKLEISLQKQSYSLYLDDPEREDICIFYTDDMENLKFQLIEQLYETYQLEGYGSSSFNDVRLKSIQTLGQEDLIDLKVLKTVENKTNSFDQKKLSLEYTVSQFPSKAQFHNKFLGFVGVKTLETRLFSQAISPTHMEISLFSMDNQLLEQIWRITPFSADTQNNQKVSLWDFQHDLVYRKNQEAAQNNQDSHIPEELFLNIFKQKSNEIIQPLEGNFPLDEDFKLYLKNYSHILTYQPVLRHGDKPDEKPTELEFSQKNNHFFFKTACPFDYISIKLYQGDPRKSSNLIGYYEESLFKIPENSLLLGYIYKDSDGRIEKQFNQITAKNKLSSDQADILNNEKNDNVVGTIKLTFDFFGFNKYLIKNSSSWVKEIKNYSEDSDQLISEIRKSQVNYVLSQKKMQPLRLSLTDIWNLADLLEQVVPSSTVSDSLDLKVKLGSYCFCVPLSVQRIEKKKFSRNEILFKLEKENERSFVERQDEKLTMFTRSSGESVLQISVNLETCNSMIFYVSSHLEWLVLEIRAVSSGDEILAFSAEQIKDIALTGQQGSIITLLQIPDKNKRNSDPTMFGKGKKPELFSNTAYFKFDFAFLVEENFGIQPQEGTRGMFTLGLVIPQQKTEIPKDKLKLLKQFIYMIVIQEVTSQRKFEKTLSFGSIQQKRFTLDYFKKFEFLKSSELLFTVKIKKVYSGNMEEDEEQAEYIYSKQFQVNGTNPIPRVEGINQQMENEKVKVKLGSYVTLECSFRDEQIQSDLDFILQLNYKFSYFLDNPYQMISLSVPPELEAKMIINDVLDVDTPIGIKLSSLSKEAQKQKKLSQEKNVNISLKKKRPADVPEVTFESFDFRDNLLLEIHSGIDVADTAISKISDLILLPCPSQNLQLPSGPGMFAWTFFNFSGKKFQFVLRMKERFPKSEKSAISSLQIQSAQTQPKEPSVNQTKSSIPKEYDVYTLKKMIKDTQLENMKLQTELFHDKKEIVKQQNAILELEDIQRRSNVKAMNSTKPKRTTAPMELSEQVNKAKQLFKSICQCGAPNPQFKQNNDSQKGFCEDCLEKMKKDYKTKYDAYKIIADQYEGFYIKNMNIDQKIIKMKNKIESIQKEAAMDETEKSLTINGDEKMLLDEINFIRQNIKLSEAELKMMKNEQTRLVNEKCQLQNSLEEKIAKKIKKITQLSKEAEEFKARRIDLEAKIDIINRQFSQQRENI